MTELNLKYSSFVAHLDPISVYSQRVPSSILQTGEKR